jgi:general stress protein 26
MQIDPQATEALSHVASLIKSIPVAMLTTLNSDGTLDSRPMAPLAMDRTGALWFFTDLRAAKLQLLHALNLAFSDPGQGIYVSLSGLGEVSTDRVRIRQLWTVAAKPWFPAGPTSPNLALLKITPDAADYWDAPHSAMVRALGMLASVVAGKPLALGSHGAHDGLTTRPA